MRACCTILALSVLFGGCGHAGKPRPGTVKVSGTVTLDGKPLARAEVHFVSDRFRSVGRTDSQGRFELVQGAVPGENRVYFTVVDEQQAIPGYKYDPQNGMDEGQLEAALQSMPPARKKKALNPLVPAEYTDPAKSNLTYDVPEAGTDSANFALRRDAKKKRARRG